MFDKPALFTEGNAAAVGRAQPDTARAQELRDHLYTLAKTAERQETQVSATIAWLNRVEGMPTQRQEVNATIRRTAADFSDAELAAIAGEGEGAEGAGEAEGGAL